MSRPGRIEFVLDEVVIRGIEPDRRYDIAESLSGELTRLAQQSLADSSARWDRATATPRHARVTVTDPSPTTLGRQVARAVFSATSGFANRGGEQS